MKVHSEIHLLDKDLGHIFLARNGQVKHKGKSSQKYVLYNKKPGKDSKRKEDNVVIMKKKDSNIITDADAFDGVEVINRKGKLTFSKTFETPKKDN